MKYIESIIVGEKYARTKFRKSLKKSDFENTKDWQSVGLDQFAYVCS